MPPKSPIRHEHYEVARPVLAHDGRDDVVDRLGFACGPDRGRSDSRTSAGTESRSGFGKLRAKHRCDQHMVGGPAEGPSRKSSWKIRRHEVRGPRLEPPPQIRASGLEARRPASVSATRGRMMGEIVVDRHPRRPVPTNLEPAALTPAKPASPLDDPLDADLPGLGRGPRPAAVAFRTFMRAEEWKHRRRQNGEPAAPHFEPRSTHPRALEVVGPAQFPRPPPDRNVSTLDGAGGRQRAPRPGSLSAPMSSKTAARHQVHEAAKRKHHGNRCRRRYPRGSNSTLLIHGRVRQVPSEKLRRLVEERACRIRPLR